MKIIYAVSSGSYSDYKVDALFSSKKLAEDFIAVMKNRDTYFIEEYELNPPIADLIRRGYSLWSVHMLKDGTTEHAKRVNVTHYDSSYFIWERTKATAYKGKGIPDILTAYVLAKTEKQAIKITNEKRIQMIAEGKFV